MARGAARGTGRAGPAWWQVAAGVAIAVAAGLAALLWQRGRAPRALSADVATYLSAQPADAGYARVLQPRALRFPEDEGPHPEYQTEWWYYTGNLTAVGPAAPRRFGFQLTFFRRALTPRPPVRASAWGTGQLYLAHFAVTDAGAGAFHSAERLARGAAGLAGAAGEPYRVWLEGWQAARITETARVEPAGRPAESSATTRPVRLVAADDPVGIDLLLSPTKPPALHGRAGFSAKSSTPGDASFYYSYPRQIVAGEVVTADGRFEVTGSAWMDHEWSTSALAADQVGWDWFALQLDDGHDLMLFQIRQAAGGVADVSSGSRIDPGGRVQPLVRGDVDIEVLDQWTSPRTGAAYPSRWRVRLPRSGLDLTVEPLVSDQELDGSFKYWEGAVTLSGTADGRPVGGRGYVELTGYAPAGEGAGLPGVD